MPDHAIQEPDRVSELALSIAWHAGLTRELVTTDGTSLKIVFPGHWTHGMGPDFRDAMLEHPGGGLISGSVELHHRASDWVRHGHHTDPAYDDVVLHVVTTPDLVETRRPDGTVVPIVVMHIPNYQLRAVEQRSPAIWSQFGGTVCAPLIAREQPQRIAHLLGQLGDTRFEQRVVRFESELTLAPPASVLVPVLFEAFGYSQNREQMLRLAQALDWPSFAPRLHRRSREGRVQLTLATLLGIGGWLPLSPAHARLAELSPAHVHQVEACWRREHDAWMHAAMPATDWTTARIRPANHPVTRIATLSSILGGHGIDFVPTLIAGIREQTTIAHLLQHLVHAEAPPLGTDRAIAITASVVLPFIMAYARSSRDDALEDDGQRAWLSLPGSTMPQAARRARQQVAGDARITGLRERDTQGLLYLDRTYCGARRCYERPIARAVVADELATASRHDAN